MEDTARGAEVSLPAGARARDATNANNFDARQLLTKLRPNDAPSALRTFVVVSAVVGVTVTAKFLVWRLTGANAGFTIYIPAVAVAAWTRGLLAGVLATLLSA